MVTYKKFVEQWSMEDEDMDKMREVELYSGEILFGDDFHRTDDDVTDFTIMTNSGEKYTAKHVNFASIKKVTLENVDSEQAYLDRMDEIERKVTDENYNWYNDLE